MSQNASWVALSRSQHSNHRFLRCADMSYSSKHILAPVNLAELAKVQAEYTIGFIRDDETISVVAVLGLDKGHNLYLHPDGRWLASYIPAALRGYPFTLAKTEQGGADKTFCIESSYLLDESRSDTLAGDYLFHEGELHGKVAETLEFLTQQEQYRIPTHKAAAALDALGLLVPWNLQIPLKEGHKSVQGLLRVDEQALNELNAADYALLKGHPMLLAYAQLFSSAQVGRLSQLYQLHGGTGSQPVKETDVDLDAFFGESEDDLFKF